MKDLPDSQNVPLKKVDLLDLKILIGIQHGKRKEPLNFSRLRVKKRTPMMTIRWAIAIYPAALRDFSTSTELTMLMEILHHCWVVMHV